MQSVACVVMCMSVAVVTVASGSTVNYCGARMCGNTDAHTFCQYPEGPSPQCIGYISAELSTEEKSRLIARLNRRRNEAAAGSLRDLASAGNMLKLICHEHAQNVHYIGSTWNQFERDGRYNCHRWVEELAREAQRWADQCRPPRVPEEHDVCRDLYSIPVGQCVASVVGEAPGLRVESMIDIWYMQNILYKGNATMYIPPSPNTSFYGDFAQIMWAQSYMVGCGRSRFMIPSQGRLRSVERLVCNIAPRGPHPGSPLWTPFAPATLCPSRSKRDITFNALCDIQKELFEEIELDPSISLEEQILLYTVLDIEQNSTLNYPRSLDEIYLTRLAVATMGNTITTEAYNLIQKRDVVEIIQLDDSNTKSNTSYIQTGENVQIISKLSSTYPTTIRTKPKMNFIGRPKPYDMEELNDEDDKTENYSPNEELVKPEVYPEDEFVESVDENSVTSTNILNDRNTLINTTNIEVVTEFNSEVIKEIVTKMYQNSSLLYEGANSQLENVNTVYSSIEEDKQGSINDNGTQALKDNVDDYLADPETVRALQEALDRMERETSTEDITERQGKVRRELRDFAPVAPPEARIRTTLSPIEQKLAHDLLNAEIERNKSIARGPMYNMVLKYMPYLKQYEEGFLPKGSGADRQLSPSIFLFLYSCVFNF